MLKKNSKTFAIALCMTTMVGLYAATPAWAAPIDQMAEVIYDGNPAVEFSDGLVVNGAANICDNLTVDGNAILASNSKIMFGTDAFDVSDFNQITANADAIAAMDTAYKAADTALQGAIAAKANATDVANALADKADNSRVANAEVRIGDAEVRIGDAEVRIGDEESAREAADNALDGKITAEADRAKAAEKANADAITALQSGKADAATTLSGYGINDAYTKTEVDSKVTEVRDKVIGAEADIDNLQAAVGNATSGLTKAVADNQAAIGTNSGKISALENAVGNTTSGLTKAVADNQAAIESVNSVLYEDPANADDGLVGKTQAITYSSANNETTIGSNLEVTGKSVFNEAVFNEADPNQVKIDSNGITVGTSSTVMDAEGFYAGAHDYANAKAGMNEDGEIKGAGGAFKVEQDGSIIGKDMNLAGGNFEVDDVGNVTAQDIKAKDIEAEDIQAETGTIGAVTMGADSATVDGKLGVTGSATIAGSATVKQNLGVQGNATINGNATVKQNLGVQGNATVNNDFKVLGDTNLKDTVVDGEFDVTGNATIAGNATVKQNLGVQGNATINGNATVKQDLGVAGNATIAGNATVKQNLGVQGNAIIAGNATVKQDLGVQGDATFRADTQTDGIATFGTVPGAQTTINGGRIEANANGANRVLIDSNGITVGQNSTHIQTDKIYINNNSGELTTEITTEDVSIIQPGYTAGATGTGSGGDNRINLSDLGQVDDIDAELKARPEYTGNQTAVGGINAEAAIRREEIARVNDRLDKVGAMSAAIANLRTMGYDPAAPSEFAMSVGQYRDQTGMAVGFFHYPHKDFMLSLSVSGAGDEYMGGIGATWKFGHRSPERLAEIEKSKAAKAKLEKALAEKKAKEARENAAAAAQSARHAKMIK